MPIVPQDVNNIFMNCLKKIAEKEENLLEKRKEKKLFSSRLYYIFTIHDRAENCNQFSYFFKMARVCYVIKACEVSIALKNS